jgi:ABC-type polysaccharide/polyol phosphate transport system ATPase subunit
MPSSSRSDSNPPILEVEDLSLVFQTDIFRAWTFRDFFTRAASDPRTMLLQERGHLMVADSISFKLRRGERLALIGVNGTGKTSLLRCIAGIYRQDSGRITVRGGMRAVFDTGVGIQPELTGRENAELLSIFLFPDESDRARLVEEALEFSELGEFVDVPFRLYSNGMQARLYLSLIASRPCGLFILDEVFEGADSFFREKISARMLEVIERSGAVIFVSHSPDQVRRVCNRAIVLHEAKVAFDGSVDDALAFYSSLHPATI